MKRLLGLCLIGYFLCMPCLLPAQDRLPLGSHPPALAFDHFPNRLFAFVWRNWNLIGVEKMASLLDCESWQVRDVAQAMGLQEAKPLYASYQKQLYITLLRRNWHLLPYDQLMEVTGMSENEMEFALKEDDFLFHKFGRLKPKVDRLRYSLPSASEWERAAAIYAAVDAHLTGPLPEDPRFSFIDQLAKTESIGPQMDRTDPDKTGLRFIYSYFGVFGDPLLDPESDPFPDGLLQKLAERGVNGVWLHVVLNQLAPEGEIFPEFGDQSDIRLKNLQKIARRAQKYGISIYLYINEPRAMPARFFASRPEMAGISKQGLTTLCTSNEQVRDWISHSLTHVFEQVPELGGVFTITASENLTNCASHGGREACPRCSKRSYADIIAEVNQVIAEGIHRANPDARVIAWDWGWHGHGPALDVIEKLPTDVALMSVSEWGLPIDRGGISTQVSEYSLSAVGPGPRAITHWAAAKMRGLETVAKVQFNNSWELSALPWLPVMDLVARHAANLAGTRLDGYMLSWTLGSYPSPNLEIARKFSQNPNSTVEQVLDELAWERYGRQAVPLIRESWTAFSEAFREFPYHQQVVYLAPQQYGPSNLLYLKPTGYAASMVGFPYDDLGSWSGPYPEEVLVSQFEKVALGWKKGLNLFQQALRIPGGGTQKAQLAEDLILAKAAYLHFLSVAQQGRFILLRKQWRTNPNPFVYRQLRKLLEMEIHSAVELHALAQADSRIGFEASNQYYYLPQDLLEKVINCEYLLGELVKQAEGKLGEHGGAMGQ
ncbi:hypothetical protein [Cyclobacterium jeungdonense]|uniref:Beta-hexosaminidase bacterial type N-terminal domain-containing protein n=1 Tax=Cyclobacterium jeungdonense TaxID=708087 RepID=A0ABT8C666_9BACT|nr:hypothetical protein [Cyclobacterium jeungdonense]MDN3687552.1 hypothetical protein [Cyclobacterium jeungdonense]